MADQDFVISFRADTQGALNQMRLLVEAAIAAETAINRVSAAVATAGGSSSLARSAQQSISTFEHLGIEVEELDKRLDKLGPNFAASFERSIRRLPTTLGDIELFKNAGQTVPTSRLTEGIRAFRALGTVFADDTELARRFNTEAVALERQLVAAARPRIRSFLDQARSGKRYGDTRLEIQSLRSAERELRSLQRAGVSVDRTMASVRQRLISLGQPVRLGIRQEIEGLLPRIRAVRETAEVRGLLGDQKGTLAALKKLEELLLRLQVRGANVSKNLAGVGAQITAVTAAIDHRTQAQQRQTSLERLQDRARARREDVLVANLGPVSGQIQALTALEKALIRLRLRGQDVRTELANVRQELHRLQGASANTREIDRLLTRQTRIQQRISDRVSQGQPESRLLNLQGERTSLELLARGHQQAAVALGVHRSALASMGPAHAAEVVALLRERDALLEAIRARERVGLRATGTQLGRGFEINQQLASTATGATAANAALDMQRFGTAIDANRGRLALWDSSFGHHARRIAEGLIIYNAFGVALGSVADSFRQVASLDREFARFEAVAGNLSKTEADKFLADLSQTSIDTNTKLRELIGTTDLVAASFTDISDAAERTEAINTFQRLAGEFSNVVDQAGNQEEVTRQLVALFRQTRVEGLSSAESLDRFRFFLDLLVTAGGRASSVINQVTEGLREIGPGAKASGADMGLLAFTIAEVVQQTGESGLSIGNTLKTVLANLTAGSKVAAVFKDIPESIVQITDQDGHLLRSTDILKNLFQAVEDGSLTIGQAQEVFRDLGPVIQPGQVGIVNEIFNAIGRGIERLETEAPRAGGALVALNDILVNTLGGRFEKVINRFENLIVTKLAGPITGAGSVIIKVLNFIIDVLENDFFRTILLSAGSFAVLVGAMGGAIALIQRLGLVFLAARTHIASLGIGALTAAAHMKNLGVATGAAATSNVGGFGAGIVAVQNLGTQAVQSSVKMRILQGAINLAALALRTFLPLLILMAAVDLTNVIGQMQQMGSILDQIDGLGDTKVGFEGEQVELESLFAGASGPKNKNQLADIFDSEETRNQAENVELLVKKLKELEEQDNLNKQKAEALLAVIVDQNGNIKDQRVLAEDLDNALTDWTTANSGLSDSIDEGNFNLEEYLASLDEYVGGALDAAGATDELTAAETRAAAALQANADLTGVRAAQYAELTRQLDEGSISLDEFTERMSNVDQATEAAAQFVAAFQNNLGVIPGLIERIAASGASPAQALTEMLLENPATIQQQIDIINRMIEIAEIREQVSEQMAANPIAPVVETEEMQDKTKAVGELGQKLVDITGLVADFVGKKNPITPIINMLPFRAQAVEYLETLGILAGAGKSLGSLSTKAGGKAGGKTLGSTKTDKTDAFLAELDALGEALREVTGIVEGDARLGEAAQARQTSFVDLGELSPALIPQIIAIASEAQRQIVAAGGTVDTDDITALLKSGVFQQLISGIDQRLLTEAIQQLTEVERRRMELEQQRLQDVTRSVVTQVGPIQSLVSSPVLAAGGGILSGQGLNADPRAGNFTINVPINWSGMSLPQLQEFIMKAIYQAWIQANRGG